MALIVQKFGGSSVKDRDRIFNVARNVANTHNAGNDVVVVVSAQGDTTDDLIAKAGEITHNPSAREMDMLLASGEQISIALLAMAQNELGCHAISLTGWQAGFRTDRAYTKARITRLETERISSELERNRVVVVAGFQGLNKLDDITTLGRGGSDTSAVAIAAALHADRCQIYTDVEGVYTADPRKVSNTRKLEEITFDEMLELASLGAQVLNNRSVELAKKYNVALEVLSSLTPIPGSVVKEVTKDMEGMLIKGVAKDTDVAVITILNVPDEPGMSFKIFGLLAQKNINVDIILQSTGRDGKKDISFKVAHFESCLEGKALRFVRHDKFTVFQGFPQVFDGKFVFLVNLVIVGRIGKDSRNDTMIDEVVLMDAGKALRNDHLDAKVHGRNGRVFAARALSIVAAANDEAHFHGLGPFGKVRIIPAVGVLGHGGHVGAHGGKLGTCQRNFGGRDVVAGCQSDAARERSFRGIGHGKRLDVGATDDCLVISFRRRLEEQAVVYRIRIRLLDGSKNGHIVHDFVSCRKDPFDGRRSRRFRAYKIKGCVRCGTAAFEVAVGRTNRNPLGIGGAANAAAGTAGKLQDTGAGIQEVSDHAVFHEFEVNLAGADAADKAHAFCHLVSLKNSRGFFEVAV